MNVLTLYEHVITVYKFMQHAHGIGNAHVFGD